MSNAAEFFFSLPIAIESFAGAIETSARETASESADTRRDIVMNQIILGAPYVALVCGGVLIGKAL